MYAVNDTSPAQLPLGSGCRNSGGGSMAVVVGVSDRGQMTGDKQHVTHGT